MNNQLKDNNMFITPPECAGQIVEVSYASDDGEGFKWTYDRSDHASRIEVCDLADCGCDHDCDCWDPVNKEPNNKIFKFKKRY